MSGEVIVDVHEPETIRVALGDLVMVAPLVSTEGGGDYLWIDSSGKTMAIERKEANDFVKSLGDGRLQEQLSRLIKAYDYPILLTEGNFNVNHDGLVVIPGKNGHLINRHIPFMTLQYALFEIQESGVYHMHTQDIRATARLIKGMFEWSQKAEHNLLNVRTRANLINGRADDPVWLVMGLPGIGIALARALIEMFGSPYAVFQAFANPNLHGLIKEIRGISDNKIDQVREVLLPNVHSSRSKQRQS